MSANQNLDRMRFGNPESSEIDFRHSGTGTAACQGGERHSLPLASLGSESSENPYRGRVSELPNRTPPDSTAPLGPSVHASEHPNRRPSTARAEGGREPAPAQRTRSPLFRPLTTPRKGERCWGVYETSGGRCSGTAVDEHGRCRRCARRGRESTLPASRRPFRPSWVPPARPQGLSARELGMGFRKPRRQVPRPVAADGSRIACGAQLGKDARITCLQTATFPDFRCCLHTRFLEGSPAERRALDDDGWKARAAAFVRWHQERGDAAAAFEVMARVVESAAAVSAPAEPERAPASPSRQRCAARLPTAANKRCQKRALEGSDFCRLCGAVGSPRWQAK